MSEIPPRNTQIAQCVAVLVCRAATVSQYPKEFQAWETPIRFYLFEVNDGDVDAVQMSSFGTGWWLAIDRNIKEIEYPIELLPTAQHPRGGEQLLIPRIKFLVQNGTILICENYWFAVGFRRRCSLIELENMQSVDEVPEIWRFRNLSRDVV